MFFTNTAFVVLNHLILIINFIIMIRIGIVDDNPVNRKNIRGILERESDVRVVSESLNGEDFLLRLKELKKDDLPQVVLMDLDMPIMGGIETIAIGSVKYPDIKFMVLTVFDDDEKLFEAIKAGASGYILKDDAALMLRDAINIAHNMNGAPMSPAIARKTLQWLKGIPQPASKEIKNQPIFDVLTDREQELLRLLIEGKSYKIIADQLFISPQTVRTHISRIYEKLHINSKAQAILLTQKYNWL